MEYGPERITYKKLAEADLPLMHRWLNTSHVRQWYRVLGKSEPALQTVADKYLPRIHGRDPVHCYLVLYDTRPVAYIQSTVIVDAANVTGIDTFIGEVDFLYKGFSVVYIRKFLKEIVFQEPKVTSCSIDPEPSNKIAIRAYKKAGFRYSRQTWNAEDKVAAYIMTIDRESIYPATAVL
jgi:RimJ/RimL family protein N-acetyltransferase